MVGFRSTKYRTAWASTFVVIGFSVPFLADIAAQIIYGGVEFSSIKFPLILKPSKFLLVISFNIIPYLLLGLLIVAGFNGLDKTILFAIDSSVTFFFDSVYGKDHSFKSIKTEEFIESQKKNMSFFFVFHYTGICVSLIIAIALNFRFHFGQLRSLYSPDIHSSSTAGLVYVVFPFYAVMAIVVIYFLFWMASYLIWLCGSFIYKLTAK